MINPDSFKGCIDDNYHTYFPIINQSPMCVFINYLQPKNVMIDCISNNFAACSMSYLPFYQYQGKHIANNCRKTNIFYSFVINSLIIGFRPQNLSLVNCFTRRFVVNKTINQLQ